jgi:protein-S-isoprenylcysteine O-methyltransferase Ste14
MDARLQFIAASEAVDSDLAERLVESELCPASVIPVTDGLAGLGSLLAAWLLVMWLKPAPLADDCCAADGMEGTRQVTRCPARCSGRIPAAAMAGGLCRCDRAAAAHSCPRLGPECLDDRVGRGSPSIRGAAGPRAPTQCSIADGGLPLALGRASLLGEWARLERAAAPARLWFLKAFFIPIYGASLLSILATALHDNLDGPFGWLTLVLSLAYTIDLAFGLSGYIFASSALVPTIRSTQPRLWGWIVCLLCYGPVFTHWSDFGRVVHAEIAWPALLTQGAGVIVAAVAMIILLALYISATVVFGLRFSNLSNRGVITSGPYRYMKHPAYFAHVGNAWIITVVFLPAAGVELTLSRLLVPVVFTVLYRYRAVTEEMHLREDERYIAYSEWIARYGLIGRLRHFLVHRDGTS